MKRRNIYIASTLVLALVLMVGFPTSARPQTGKGIVGKFKSHGKLIPPIISVPEIVKSKRKSRSRSPTLRFPNPR